MHFHAVKVLLMAFSISFKISSRSGRENTLMCLCSYLQRGMPKVCHKVRIWLLLMHSFYPCIMKLGQNDYLMDSSYYLNINLITKKCRFFIIGNFLGMVATFRHTSLVLFGCKHKYFLILPNSY